MSDMAKLIENTPMYRARNSTGARSVTTACVNGACIICHGSSGARAIKNAVRVGVDYIRSDVNSMILQRLTEEQSDA